MIGSALRAAPLFLLLLALPLWLIQSDRQAESSFSSSQRLGENRLTTATVDLSVDLPTTVLVTDELLPGDQQWLELQVTNTGSVPILIAADVVPEAGSDGLTDLLTVDVMTIDRCGEPQASGQSPVVADIRVDVDRTTAVCVVASLPLSTANAAQGKTSRFSIVVTGVHDLDG